MSRKMPPLRDPSRTIRLGSHRGHSELCAELGLGEYREPSKHLFSGWFVNQAEYAALLAEYERRAPEREEKARAAVREWRLRNPRPKREPRPPPAVVEAPPYGGLGHFKPPHDAEEKAVRNYALLLNERSRLGHALTDEIRVEVWHKARAFCGLRPNSAIPDVEPTESHADHIATLAVSRADVDGDTDEENSRRAKRRSAKRRNKRGSRGAVGNVLNRR